MSNFPPADPYAAADKIIASIEAPRIPEEPRINLDEYSGITPSHVGEQDFLPWLQKAVDELSENGGGTVCLRHPAGATNWFKTPVVYRLSGPLELKSKVRLALEPSIRLVFDFDPDRFNNQGKGTLCRYEGTMIYGPSACIRAFNTEDIEICALPGSGPMPVIDGSGEAWQRWMWDGDFGPNKTEDRQRSYMKLKYDINQAGLPLSERNCADVTQWFLRPDLLQPLFCKRFRLAGVELKNSPFWVVHPVYCTDLIFQDIRFDCMNVNNDGIDPESCSRVLIERVQFYNYDDNIAIKSGRDRDAREGVAVAGTPMEGIDSPWIRDGRTRDHASHMVIRNNIFKGHYAICIGSESSGGASDIYALDNQAPQEVNMMLNLKSSRSRGGITERVLIENFRANRVTDAAICLIPNYDNDTESPYPPLFRDVYVSNVEIGSAKRGILVYGWPDRPTENICLKKLTLGKVESKELEVIHARQIRLEDVSMNGQTFDGVYDHKDADTPVPHQI